MKRNTVASCAVAASCCLLLLQMMQFCSARNDSIAEDRLAKDQIQIGSSQKGSFVVNETIKDLPISQVTHLRLLHRSKRDAVDYAVAGLKLLGIPLSLAYPNLGKIVAAAVGVMIPFFFPGDDDQTRIQDIVWDERSKQQRMKMTDIKNHLEEIRDHYKTNATLTVANQRLLNLFDSMSTVRCSFMHKDNVRSSAAYFESFATLHLEINLLLIVIHKGEPHWQRVLERNVDTYVKYGYFVIQKDAAYYRNFDNVYKYSYNSDAMNMKPFKLEVRIRLEPSIQKWIKLSPNAAHRNGLIYYGSVRHGGFISLKLAVYKDPWWWSCWNFYWFECDMRGCPREDNPMNPGCRGEKFQIKAIDEAEDGIIRTCSWVGLFYTYMNGRYWWLTVSGHARSCPGVSTASMKSGSCSREAWKIEVPGKPCGVPVTDRDVVFFTNKATGLALGELFIEPRRIFDARYFVAFRSDVEHGKYNEGLKTCAGEW